MYGFATVSVVVAFIGVVIFAPSERPARRLERIIRAWRRRSYRAAPAARRRPAGGHPPWWAHPPARCLRPGPFPCPGAPGAATQ